MYKSQRAWRGRKAKACHGRSVSLAPVPPRSGDFLPRKAIRRLLSRVRRTRVAKYSLSFLSGFYHVRIYISGTRIRGGRQIEIGRRSDSRCCASSYWSFIVVFFAFRSPSSSCCGRNDTFLADPYIQKRNNEGARDIIRLLGKSPDELWCAYRILDRDGSETVTVSDDWDFRS